MERNIRNSANVLNIKDGKMLTVKLKDSDGEFYIKPGATLYEDRMNDRTVEVDKLSVTVNLYYTGTNGNARKFADEMIYSGIVDAIRNEAGNERYDYFVSLKNQETVLLIDSWKDQNAIDLHHSTPMMKKIIELREKYDLHMEIERYVSEDSEISESDKQFIRE